MSRKTNRPAAPGHIRTEENQPNKILSREPQEGQEQKTVIRVSKRSSPYAVIDKYFLDEDRRLSWKAKGLLAYLLAKPDDWQVYVKDLISRSMDGKASVYAGLKELEQAGYIERRKLRDEKGKIVKHEIYVYERPKNSSVKPFLPDPDFQDLGFQDLAFRDLENRTLLINNKDTNYKTTNEQQQKEAVVVGEKEIEEFMKNAREQGIPLSREEAALVIKEAGSQEQAQLALELSVSYIRREKAIKLLKDKDINKLGVLINAAKNFVLDPEQYRERKKEKNKGESKYADLFLS